MTNPHRNLAKTMHATAYQKTESHSAYNGRYFRHYYGYDGEGRPSLFPYETDMDEIRFLQLVHLLWKTA